jgi:hypothetical protein
MVAVTSGTTTFSMDVDDIILKAFKPLGGDSFSGQDIADARTTLNLVLIELQNKNIPVNKIDTVSVPVLADTIEYALDPSISDVLEVTLKSVDSEFETKLLRESVKSYHSITYKTQPGRPNLFTTERKTVVTLKLWPVIEDSGDYTLEILCVKKVEDVTASYQKIDLSYRYLPLLVRWLSYELSLDRVGVPADIRAELKQNLSETMNSAFEEDRERTDFIITVNGVSGF